MITEFQITNKNRIKRVKNLIKMKEMDLQEILMIHLLLLNKTEELFRNKKLQILMM